MEGRSLRSVRCWRICSTTLDGWVIRSPARCSTRRVPCSNTPPAPLPIWAAGRLPIPSAWRRARSPGCCAAPVERSHRPTVRVPTCVSWPSATSSTPAPSWPRSAASRSPSSAPSATWRPAATPASASTSTISAPRRRPSCWPSPAPVSTCWSADLARRSAAPGGRGSRNRLGCASRPARSPSAAGSTSCWAVRPPSCPAWWSR